MLSQWRSRDEQRPREVAVVVDEGWSAPECTRLRRVSYTAGVKTYSFAIVIEKEPEDPGYFAYSPTLPGCFGNGPTIEATRANIREAIQQHLESLIAQGEVVPQSLDSVHVEEMTLSLPG